MQLNNSCSAHVSKLMGKTRVLRKPTPARGEHANTQKCVIVMSVTRDLILRTPGDSNVFTNVLQDKTSDAQGGLQLLQ